MDATKLALIKDRTWINTQGVPSAQWKCAYCSREVASNIGFAITTAGPTFFIRICSNCSGPTFFTPEGEHSPAAAPGNQVEHVPHDLDALFADARAAAGAGAFTAAVLTCRKMLMHLAVSVGDTHAPGKRFLDYVTYLVDNHYVPPDGKGWVDYIRKRSNEANHEIVLMAQADAIALISFVELLLRFIYEFPKRVPQPAPPPEPAAPEGHP